MLRRSAAFVVSLTLFLIGVWCLPAQSAVQKQNPRDKISGKAQTGTMRPVVLRSLKNDTTKIPLRDMKPIPFEKEGDRPEFEIPNRILPKALLGHYPTGIPAKQAERPQVPNAMPPTFTNFEGQPNNCACLPPDTNGAVGPSNYVQTVNATYQVWDKSGNSLLGPIPINTIWTGFGGFCETHNNGDPIVLYDHLAGRWLISQFAVFTGDVTDHQCIAISASGDPTGLWHRYDFPIGGTDIFPDYPHFGIWPDGYYMSINQFDQALTTWKGAGAVAFERDRMLDGLSAQQIYFDEFGFNNCFGGQLPSSLDGPPPPAGTPNYFGEVDDDAFACGAGDNFKIWEFVVDWTTPANSTFGIAGQPNWTLTTAPITMGLCGFSRNCIPEPGGATLDAISDRLMHRLQYRNFGTYATLVANHTTDADPPTNHAGVEWYEFRNDGTGWTIFQEGTYAPDSDHRWMASAAMDSAGNIAIGYSVSSSSTFPSIRYAGRLASDPLGTMGQGEGEIIAGAGSQTHPAARWGDYSGLSVDYSSGSTGGADCDFWYTTEYLQATTSADWKTRVGAFTFAPGACGGPAGTLQGTITDASTTNPIAGANVQVGAFSTTSDGTGHYQINLAVGTYNATASAFGYLDQTVNGIVISDGVTTTQDFALNTAPSSVVSGTVTDNGGHGWPLYARIDIDGYPGGPVFTNPVTGVYSVTLPQGTLFPFHVNAVSAGYVQSDRDVTPAGATQTEDFALDVTGDCSAPGYGITGGILENFDSATLPAGWTVLNNGVDTDMEWRFDNPGGRSNNTGGSGAFAIADSDNLGCCGDPEDTELRTPVMDFTGITGVAIDFDSDFNWYDFSMDEKCDVDVSTDGGATWANVLRYQGADVPGPHHETIDISATADNQANVMVRFRFYDADFEFWWAIDNVEIGNLSCVSNAGGLLVGNVIDANTSLGVNGAKVTSDNDSNITTTAFATPDDANVEDGLYILFSPLTGAQPFTASKNKYSDDTQTPTITADATTGQNFSLQTGQLIPSPLLIENTLNLDLVESATDPLTLTNNGLGSLDFEVQEANGLTNAPQHIRPKAQGHGAELQRIKGHYFPGRSAAEAFPGMSKANGKKFAAKVSKATTQTRIPNDPPWTGIADYPNPIMDNTCTENEGLVYCFGGTDGFSAQTSANVYDPGSNSWSAITAMPNAHQKASIAAVDGLIYVISGWGSSGSPIPNVDVYDPGTDSWSSVADIPAGESSGPAVVDNGLIYVVGGCSDANCAVTDNVFVYDPAADSWTALAPYPTTISWNACGGANGLIYCAGGFDGVGESNATYVYDPGADSWSPLANMPQTQWAMGYIASGGLFYISGGVTDNFATVTNEGFVYDPSADTWTPIENSNNALYRGGSACGFYRVAGSSGGFTPTTMGEVYPGLTDCAGVTDVPWLSENPTSGTLAGGASQNVDVTMDTAFVSAPGDYVAHLKFKDTTPYSTPQVNVIMHVVCPFAVDPAAGALPDGNVGDPYVVFVVPQGGQAAFSWALSGGTLPAGMFLDSTTGGFYGLPTAGGDFTFDVTVTDSRGCSSGTVSYTLHIAGGGGCTLFCDEFDDATVSTSWTYNHFSDWSEAGTLLSVNAPKKSFAIANPAFAGGCDICSTATSFTTTDDSSKVSFYGQWTDKKHTMEALFKFGGNKIILKQRNGTVVKKQAIAFSLDANTTYQVMMTNDGTNVVLNVNGTDIATFTTVGSLLPGTTGFQVVGDASFDYIHVN